MRHTMACPGGCGRQVAWLTEDERIVVDRPAELPGAFIPRQTRVFYRDMHHDGADCEWFAQHRAASVREAKERQS